MAFLVARRDGRYEIRESITTARGPRARTLATFRVLTSDIVEGARRRAQRHFDAAKIRSRAAELRVPQQANRSDATARRLIGELRAGDTLAPALARALMQELPPEPGQVSPDLVGALEWVGRDDEFRGRALYDLLDLASHLPQRRRAPRIAFPRISSAVAS
jgi:hypothetical protein